MNDNNLDFLTPSEVSLTYHNKVPFLERPQINSAKKAYDVFMMAWDKNRLEMVEQFNILLLNRKNSCLGFSNISTGGIHGCFVDPKIVFATALKANATGIILAHNHPSGNLEPSVQDRTITSRFASVGEELSLKVIDHLIVSPEGYYSFADEGFIPF